MIIMASRPLWLMAGLIATGLAIAGTVLPLVPTTPFLLLASFAFARSSPRLHAWLADHPSFGRLIKNWRRHGSLDRGAKLAAVVAMGLMLMITWLGGLGGLVLAIQGVVLALVALFILTRPTTPAEGDSPRPFLDQASASRSRGPE